MRYAKSLFFALLFGFTIKIAAVVYYQQQAIDGLLAAMIAQDHRIAALAEGRTIRQQTSWPDNLQVAEEK